MLERLIVAHESYEEITESWAAEVRRRIAEYDAGETEGIPMEVVLAEMRAMVAEGEKNWQPPPVPDDMEDIEEQALHLTHDDFYTLLVNVEAGLPSGIDPHWRADIRARIQAVPAKIERRHREQVKAAWLDEAEQRMDLVRRGEMRLLDADEVLADPEYDD